MSVGTFIGITPAYHPEARKFAESFIAAINDKLRALNLPQYREPDAIPDVYKDWKFGLSALDHIGAGSLVKLGELALQHNTGNHAPLFSINPYRLAFLPHDFPQPLQTDYREKLWGGQEPNIWAGSSVRLLEELEKLALHLQIQFENGRIVTEQVNKINDLEPFVGNEGPEITEGLRPAWLLMYEAARLSIAHQIAFCLAG